MVDDRNEKNNGKKDLGDRRQKAQSPKWGEMLKGFVVDDAMQNTQDFCGHEESEDLLEDRLWLFAEGQMDDDAQSLFWEKIKDCKYCISKLARMIRSLENAENEICWSADRLKAVIQKQKRQKTVKLLSKRLEEVRSILPASLGARFEKIVDGLKAKLQASFSYPSPRFSPVYGKSHHLSISPFGKVRYPIVFEWQKKNHAAEYVLKIDDVGWVEKTTQNRVTIEAGACDFSLGEEYMWELAVFVKDELIDEESGFIELATAPDIQELEQIETTLQAISDEFERVIIFAGILEQKRFFTEAIFNYSLAYEQDPIPSIAYRIASCYDQLEVKDLSEKWNREIPLETYGE